MNVARPTPQQDGPVIDDDVRRILSQSALTSRNFRQLAKNGIGDPANAYVHGMAWFEGRLYCGMTRNSFKLLRLFPPIDPPALEPWPVDVPPRVEDLDMQGQIWRWTPETDTWELAYRSPMIPGKKGEPAPRDLGYRGMTVFQGVNDPKPCLYVSTMSTVLRGCAAHVLRSEDGLNFEPACEPGIGNDRISTFRELVSFDGYLYAPPAGEGIQFNSNRTGVIKRSKDPRPGNWEVAMDIGFGDPTNNGIFMMKEANGFLYAGTFNCFEGYQIWKTPPCGDGPLKWTKVIEQGAYRGPPSEIAMAMEEFNGALYVGSSIQNGGYDRTNLVGPASGEIIRIWPDDSWDLLVGSGRETPIGTIYPKSGMGPGFDSVFAGYTWRMCVHEGWLYTTTFDWSVFLQYAHRPSPTSRKLVNAHSYEQLAGVGGGFEMWRTNDGVNWQPVTINGMGNPYNYGGRTMVSTPKGLAVGTANVFGGKSPARLASRWMYVENPDGGTEVFLGDPGHRDYSIPKRKGRKSKKPDIAATGATGYIGSHLIPEILEQGYRLRLLTLPGTADDIEAHPNLEVIEGTLEDHDVLGHLVKDAPKIVHLAARLAGSCDRDTLRATNVLGTQTLLRAAIAGGAMKHFVFASSVAVYEHQFKQSEWPIHEAHALRTDGGHDLADYGMSKIAGENIIRFYGREHGFTHSIMRLALVYGVGDPLVDPMIRDNAPEPGFGTGPDADQQRQFVHVRDAAEAVARAIFDPRAEDVTFNVAGPDVITYAEMGRQVRIALGKPTHDDLIPDRARVWRRYVQQYDMTRGKEKLGFVPSVPFAEGLRQIVEHAQKNGTLPTAMENDLAIPGAEVEAV